MTTERCKTCNAELSPCGPQDDDGEPSMDCQPCQLTAQRDSALAELAKVMEERDGSHIIGGQLIDEIQALRADLADARDTILALQLENEALRKTVAQMEEVLRDIADKLKKAQS